MTLTLLEIGGNVASIPLVSQPIKVTEDTYFKTDITVAGSGNFTSGVFINGATAVKSDTNGITNASGVTNIVQMTQAAYDALSSYDVNTLYYIV